MGKGMTPSGKTDYETPDYFFEKLEKEFHFDLDAAATSDNAKCERFYSPEEDALRRHWDFRVAAFLNPPYGRGNTEVWLKKAYEESSPNRPVVVLVPASTDTEWWHEWVMSKASEVRLVRGRLKFSDRKGSPPWGSAVVVFRGPYKGLPTFVGMNRY